MSASCELCRCLLLALLLTEHRQKVRQHTTISFGRDPPTRGERPLYGDEVMQVYDVGTPQPQLAPRRLRMAGVTWL